MWRSSPETGTADWHTFALLEGFRDFWNETGENIRVPTPNGHLNRSLVIVVQDHHIHLLAILEEEDQVLLRVYTSIYEYIPPACVHECMSAWTSLLVRIISLKKYANYPKNDVNQWNSLTSLRYSTLKQVTCCLSTEVTSMYISRRKFSKTPTFARGSLILRDAIPFLPVFALPPHVRPSSPCSHGGTDVFPMDDCKTSLCAHFVQSPHLQSGENNGRKLGWAFRKYLEHSQHKGVETAPCSHMQRRLTLHVLQPKQACWVTARCGWGVALCLLETPCLSCFTSKTTISILFLFFSIINFHWNQD